MMAPMVPVRLGNRFKAPSKANRVFDLNPPPSKRPVESNVLGGPFLTSGLTPWRGSQTSGMEFLDADISQVARRPHTSG